MYFQACSNSAYPMHSGGLYRTSGSLVKGFQVIGISPVNYSDSEPKKLLSGPVSPVHQICKSDFSPGGAKVYLGHSFYEVQNIGHDIT